MRLLLLEENGSQTVKGFVQYCQSEMWSTICASSHATEALEKVAQVACGQLGYSVQGKYNITITVLVWLNFFSRSADADFERNCNISNLNYVRLNCPTSEICSLQQCDVVRATESDCPCTIANTGLAIDNQHRRAHAQLVCTKGRF